MLNEEDDNGTDANEIETIGKKSSVEGRIIKPCPFCGNEAHTSADDYTFFVVCINCRAKGPIVSTMEEPDEAIEVWNKRAL